MLIYGFGIQFYKCGYKFRVAAEVYLVLALKVLLAQVEQSVHREQQVHQVQSALRELLAHQVQSALKVLQVQADLKGLQEEARVPPALVAR